MKPHAYIFRNATEALPRLLRDVLDYGATRPSRNGAMKELNAVQIQLTHPEERYQIAQGRKASLPAQIAESAWILSGRNDVDWLTNYLPQAKRFSDDGETWRGGYGPRLRAWPVVGGTIDQLQHVVDLLERDPDSRRAIMTIYNPAIDTEDGLDIPCNQYVQFMVRDDRLHMSVSIRSNDLMWGWSGINTFEWSVVHQAVAEILGVDMGPVTFSIASLHLYERHWEKAQRIVDTEEAGPRRISWDTPAVFSQSIEPSVENLDRILRVFFETEQAIREGGGWVYIPDSTLFHQWLLVLDGWWKGNATAALERHPVATPAIWTAAHESPANKRVSLIEVSHRVSEDASGQVGLQDALDDYTPNTVTQDRAVHARQEAMKRHPAGRMLHHASGRPLKPSGSIEDRRTELRGQTFVREVSKLHEEKHVAYGDSWKRRGEMLGIMANIARKVDRLGANGGGDTATDTAIDLLVYLIKYDLWIMEETGDIRSHVIAEPGEGLSEGLDHTHQVARYLQHLQDRIGAAVMHQDQVPRIEEDIRDRFTQLEHQVTEKNLRGRASIVELLIVRAWQLAAHLWLCDKQAKEDAWKAGNATRVWAGYDDDVDEDVEE